MLSPYPQPILELYPKQLYDNWLSQLGQLSTQEVNEMTMQSGLGKRLNSLLFLSGFVATGLWSATAIATESLRLNQGNQQQSQAPISAESFAPQPLEDGIYLYGETEQPNQIGASYMVMEVNDGQAVGALYMPYSSFDCFQGEFQGNQLDMTVVNSYDRSSYGYSFAVQSDNYIASIDDPVSTPVRLNGMYNLAEVSNNDRRILETCKADF